jgi:hypothetical protein
VKYLDTAMMFCDIQLFRQRLKELETAVCRYIAKDEACPVTLALDFEQLFASGTDRSQELKKHVSLTERHLRAGSTNEWVPRLKDILGLPKCQH